MRTVLDKCLAKRLRVLMEAGEGNLKKADTDLCLPLHEDFRNPGKTGNDFKVFLFQVWTRRNEENYKNEGTYFCAFL